MFGLFKSSKANQIAINGLDNPIQSEGKETILSAALRQGIRFPHSCRVGGCATCKCKLIEGQVKELTESAYILSREELEQGYILACQSQPKSDIRIQVDNLSSGSVGFKAHLLNGEITSRRRLTHDIVALEILLPAPLQFAAGQYGLLSVPGVIEEPRSYSFANPPSEQGSTRVQFYIRRVADGAMSNWVQDDSVVGTQVQLQGPFGEFYLRESDRPMLCIAGGSGLAPIKSLLEDALAFKNPRKVVFLFGARQQKDLYCLESIRQLQQQWAGDFRFVPVLSEEPEESGWAGARGLVTDFIGQLAEPESQAYLCGPPAMLDAAEIKLKQIGIADEHIFSDRFFDRSNLLKQA